MIDALIKGDKATGDLAKDFNLTYDAAAGVRNELIEIGNLSGNIALNARALQESMVAVGQSLGSNAMLNQADLETFTELREMAGYTNEELIGIQKLTLATGGNLKDNTKQFLGTVAALNAQNKLTINEKQLLKEVSNTSAAIKLSIGGTTKELAAAAFQAKQFGINLEQADKIAESLLDFESSITAELEAELLTGKDLNLEKARLLALNGDIAGASAEILKQVKGSAEFTKMNRIQQEALAKAVGMSREDLAASLIEREALIKLGEKDKTGIEAYNRLKSQGLSDAQIAIELGNEQYATQLKQQSIQERFNQSVEKLKEIFISIAEPVLAIISPIVDILLPVISTINFIVGGWMKIFSSIGGYISKLIGPLGEVGKILKGIASIAVVYAAYQAYASLAAIPFIGVPLGIAAAAAATAAGFGLLGSIKDGEIDPTGKKPILSGNFGSVQLDPKDKAMYGADGTIKVGTNLDGGKSNLSDNTIKIGTNLGREKSNSSPQQDLSPLLEEMRAMRQETSKSNNKPVIVENSMNGTQFGTAVAINTYKIQ
jgi:DNA-binding XRE family transcriptional regulator